MLAILAICYPFFVLFVCRPKQSKSKTAALIAEHEEGKRIASSKLKEIKLARLKTSKQVEIENCFKKAA